MQFDPRRLIAFGVFAAAMFLAIEAREGSIDPAWALAGGIAAVAIEVLVFAGPVFQRLRGR